MYSEGKEVNTAEYTLSFNTDDSKGKARVGKEDGTLRIKRGGFRLESDRSRGQGPVEKRRHMMLKNSPSQQFLFFFWSPGPLRNLIQDLYHLTGKCTHSVLHTILGGQGRP